MTPSERLALKLAIDRRVRELTAGKDPTGHRRCAGCGGDWSANTIGCKQCKERNTRRAKRAANLDAERERMREYKRRQRQRDQQRQAA